ncbi:nitrogen fixation protein NifX [Paludibacterium yongneupense]|uniref:nitrogen fixation protein NifX n=1 Tax=Paludibacterium yongneupense TaxID=400061 RepID=UPI0004220AB1|nr:nitrogen fixation protein NifX [Paludibacterium yongneupense]
MKIAFLTTDKQCVDAHFGWGRYIALYDIDALGYRYLETIEFPEASEDGNEDKLLPRLEALRDVAIVYVAAIGGSAAARVVARKVHPIKVRQPEPILDLLDALQNVLRGTPPPWLRKALLKDRVDSDFDFESEDEHGH